MEDKEVIWVPVLITYDPIMGAKYEEQTPDESLPYGKFGDDDSIIDNFIFWEHN